MKFFAYTCLLMTQVLSNASAAPLAFRYFTYGNATNPELNLEVSNDFFIGQDKTEIIRVDQHFQVTSSLVVGTDLLGRSKLMNYSGREETKLLNEDVDYPVDDLRFGMSNLAIWMGKAVDRVKSVGFLKTSPMKIKVFSNCSDMVNAYYLPTLNMICTGHVYHTLGRRHRGGMGSLALDADVMVHELGHGILHHVSTMAQGNFMSYQNDNLGAMNEGQADFITHVVTGSRELAPWTMVLFKDLVIKQKPQLFPYIAKQVGLRTINNKHSLKDFSGHEVHEDGKVVAGTLFELSTIVGKTRALKLWLTAVSKINEVSNFYDHAQLVLEANRALYQEQNQVELEELFKKRGFMGNQEIEDLSFDIEAKVLDNPKQLTAVLKTLGVSPVYARKVVAEVNSDGLLDVGECASVELKIKNMSQDQLVGLELFVPRHLLPKGLELVGQNRNYIGELKVGESYPETLDLNKKSRPWLLVCADETYESKALPVFIRHAGETVVRKDLKIAAEPLSDE